jgi:alpha-galactosidase
MKSYFSAKVWLSVSLLSIFILAKGQEALQLAPTPPMGWNSWNCFRAAINEDKIKAMADAMVSSGLKDAGYQYIIIDDGWATKSRDSAGHIIPDAKKFPHGIKAVADYVHSKGLKFGIYSSPGCFTCQKLMGSIGHEQMDANDYASWGVDYLKYDWCNFPSKEPESLNTPIGDCRVAFELMGKCLKNTGRPIVYSVNDECDKGGNEGALPWVKTIANMHRTGDDIKNNWERMLYCLDLTADLWEYAQPGYWNDPDMLEVGNDSRESLWGKISPVTMTVTEYRSHFAMWCMVAAPLIAGNDLRSMTPEIGNILTNKALIDVDQDPLGKQGRRIRKEGELEVWVKELAGDRVAVALFNRSGNPADINVKWNEIGICGTRKVSDLWAGRDLGKFRKSYTGVKVRSHEARILLISP